MSFELEIDVMKPNLGAFLLHRKGAPEGVEVGPLTSEAFYSLPHVSPQALTFVVSIGTAAAVAAKEAVKEVAKDKIKKWLVDFIDKLKAEKVRINGVEAEDHADLERMISEKIEIDRNDGSRPEWALQSPPSSPKSACSPH